jgi:predicted AAA+ superfamily ATPase
LKNIYDNYPDVNIVYTGSSLLSIDYAVADLSRRQTLYTLHGLSFREYLAFEDITEISPLSLDNLLDNHLHYAMDITKQIKVAPYFESYLKHGYYPFYKESLTDFLDRLRQTASIAIDIDLPSVEEVSFETLIKIKRLLAIISEQVPFVPNMSSLWKELSTNNTLGIRMLYALDRAGILSLVTNNIKNYKHLSKPDKILLNDTNLMHALCTNVNKGSERETFFHSQLSVGHKVSIPSQGDFLIDNTILFEVGGKRKTFEQIKDESNGYLAVDDTEIGHAHRIPLWMFGLLY